MVPGASDATQEFIAHFWSLSTEFCKDYDVLFHGTVQNPDNWGLLIEDAGKRTLYLTLRSKMYECLCRPGAHPKAEDL